MVTRGLAGEPHPAAREEGYGPRLARRRLLSSLCLCQRMAKKPRDPSQDVTGTTRDRMLLDVPSIRSASAITKRRERIELPARC